VTLRSTGVLAVLAAGACAVGACDPAPAEPRPASTSAPAAAPGPAGEARVEWKALRNGDFEDQTPPVDVDVPRRIPWWRSTHGWPQLELQGGDGPRLRTGPDEFAEQPFAAYAPLAAGLEISGRVHGAGVLTVIDGSGEPMRFPLRAEGEQGHAFHIKGEDLARALGRAPTPRFVLRLEGDGASTAWWDDVDVVVPLPCPSESALRAEVVAQLDAIFRAWEERALDDLGDRRTAFVAKSFDIVTGADLAVLPSAPTFFPLQEALLDAVAAEDQASWRAFLERYLQDLFAHALHPATGLPNSWNPRTDARDDEHPSEIALPLGFLIDVALEGPERFRAQARAAAQRIGDVVLAKGLLPDGNVAASYFPQDARLNLDVNPLRRFDVPCQMARLSALTKDPRYLEPAREALAVFEFTHVWAGTWDQIDPAFDDDYGTYGARAATIARALPDEVLFERFAIEGMLHFLPLWRDAMRFGGNLAADQVRGWWIAADLVRTEPSLRPQLAPIVADAVHAHVQGEQYGNGAWGDLTVFGFDPRGDEKVGDFRGTPTNLLNGLAAVYGSDLGLRTDVVRGLYTAVLRSSVKQYGRPHGFLLGPTEQSTGNTAFGSLRILLGLTTMLDALTEAPR